jgi:bifunctional DNA-binding transcriptional regulator/antitoxin component of YhaV-PrlF toxin-antitoxin module
MHSPMEHSSTTILSDKYTLSIPKYLRGKIKMRPGQKFQIIESDNKLEFIPVKDVKTLRGYLAGMDTDFEREEDRNG